jgi:hypothetical protein
MREMRGRSVRAFPFLAVGLTAIALVSSTGCGTTKVTGTPRTATEQLLLTNAWDDALRKVDFRPLTGVPVYLDTQYVSAIDQGWIISSIRQAMLQQGVLLRTKPEQAQWVVEARVGAYGTDSYNWFLGIPQTTIPQTITGIPAGTIPQMSFAKRDNQEAMAKLALFAYDRSSGQITWHSGPSLATASAKDVYIGGLGPIQSGSIRSGSEFVGIRLPTLSDRESNAANTSSAQRGDGAPPGSSMPLPASAGDLNSFAP